MKHGARLCLQKVAVMAPQIERASHRATECRLADVQLCTPPKDEAMKEDCLSVAVEARLTSLERELTYWRGAAGLALVALAAAGTMAFRHGAPGALEASSLTIMASQGNAVTLSVRSSGELEARFSGTRSVTSGLGDSGARQNVSAGLAIVNPSGREVIRIGDPATRQLAP
jgi:hypothetical protein